MRFPFQEERELSGTGGQRKEHKQTYQYNFNFSSHNNINSLKIDDYSFIHIIEFNSIIITVITITKCQVHFMSVKCNRKLYKKPINIIIDVLIFDICNHRNMINISPCLLAKTDKQQRKHLKTLLCFDCF